MLVSAPCNSPRTDGGRCTDQNDALTVIGIDDLPFGAARPTEQLFAIWSAADPSPYCQTVLWIPRALGLPSIRRYPSSLAIAAADMARPSQKLCPKLSRLLIVGTLWRIPAERFLVRSASRCAGSGRQSVGSNVVDPKLLTYAEKLQYEGYLRRQETNEAIRELSKQGTSIRQMVRQTGHSRKIVRDVLRGQRQPSEQAGTWLPGSASHQGRIPAEGRSGLARSRSKATSSCERT